MELHLAYTHNAAYIGAPRRNDYQIARLEPGRPLREARHLDLPEILY